MSDSYTPAAPDRRDVAAEDLAAYDRILERTGAMRDKDGFGSVPERGGDNPFVSALLNSPIIGYHYFELGVYYRTRGEIPGSYSHADREWVDMVLMQDIDYWTLMWAHLPDAVAVGVRPEAIKALREQRLDDLTPHEAQLTDVIRRVRDGTMDRASYEGLEELFGTRGAIDYIGFIGHILMTIPWYKAFGSNTRTEADVDELLGQILDGSYELPHPKARVPLPETVWSFELLPIGRREI